MRFNTPLRYPGGKGKLSNFIKLVFDNNNLVGTHYVEPFAGGAGVAMNLLMNGYASHVHLNDLNFSVYAFWRSVLDFPDELCRRINDTPVSMDEWYKQKDIMTNATDNSLLDVGFSTFFLNRTNRSGILLGGVIGGKEQKGLWKLDARFNRLDLIKRIQKIAEKKDDISLYNLDALKLLTDVCPTLPDNSFVYLDPPYYVKGKGLYQNHYNHADHETIADMVGKNSLHPWIVSYDNTPEINSMYSRYRKIEYGINYSAQQRYKGPEVMFFSPKLVIPNVDNPVKIAG